MANQEERADEGVAPFGEEAQPGNKRYAEQPAQHLEELRGATENFIL